MPCSDSNYDDGSTANAFYAMELLCDICKDSANLKAVCAMNPNIEKWWYEHRRRDYMDSCVTKAATKYPHDLKRRSEYERELQSQFK